MLTNPMEGPWEQVQRELEVHAKELRGHRVRFYIVDEGLGKSLKPKTVAEAFAGYIGSSSFDPPDLSTNAKNAFGEIIAEKYRKQGLDV